jgi:hypothetical protein
MERAESSGFRITLGTCWVIPAQGQRIVFRPAVVSSMEPRFFVAAAGSPAPGKEMQAMSTNGPAEGQERTLRERDFFLLWAGAATAVCLLISRKAKGNT